MSSAVRHRVLPLVLALLILCSMLATAPGTVASKEIEDDSAKVIQNVTYRLTGNDTVAFEISYELHPSVRTLSLSGVNRGRYQERSLDGFEKIRGGEIATYVWDEQTENPQIKLVLPIEWSALATGTEGEWVLIPTFEISSVYSDDSGYYASSDSVGSFATEYVVESEGYIGQGLVLLGPHETWEFDTPSHQITVVEPANVSSKVDRATIKRNVRMADHVLPAQRRETITAFVSPNTSGNKAGQSFHAWSNRSSQTIWVYGQRGVGTWIHEYVHTQQGYTIGDGPMSWFTEGSATFFQRYVQLASGDITFSTYRNRIEYGIQRTRPTVLTGKQKYTRTDYDQGGLVLAGLDAEIRERSNGERTVVDVFTRVYNHDSRVTYGVFQEIVADVAGEPMDGWLDRYLNTTATPPVPNDPDRYLYTFDSDIDGDDLPDHREVEIESDPLRVDTDLDGLDDGDEVAANADPTVADTDRDGLKDGDELRIGADPTVTDTDGDGLSDSQEAAVSANPTSADTDSDGLPDPEEVRRGTDPTRADSDSDDLEDGREVELGTNPSAVDTDMDGKRDGVEVAAGTDPLTAPFYLRPFPEQERVAVVHAITMLAANPTEAVIVFGGITAVVLGLSLPVLFLFRVCHAFLEGFRGSD